MDVSDEGDDGGNEGREWGNSHTKKLRVPSRRLRRREGEAQRERERGEAQEEGGEG